MARVFLIMALAMALATSLASAITPNEEGEERTADALSFSDPLSSEDVSPSARGAGRLLAQYNRRASVRCDKHPGVCQASGSPGPDCCKRKCVNVMTDGHNCGRCGRRCRYGQTCCGGRCVNVLFDPKNCGSCHNECKTGGFCNYGLCSYA